jgi:hypothetical protein
MLQFTKHLSVSIDDDAGSARFGVSRDVFGHCALAWRRTRRDIKTPQDTLSIVHSPPRFMARRGVPRMGST